MNGLGSQIVHSVRLSGWYDAVLSAFGISVIVWIACFRGTRLIFQKETDEFVRQTLLWAWPCYC